MTSESLPFRPGERFCASALISAEMHAAFVQVFGDANPLHTDDAFARARGFQGRVMHGNILGGILSRLVGECLPTKAVIIHSQTLRFAAPVYLGDRIALDALVTDVHESVRVVALKLSFTNGDATVVASGTVQIGVLPT